MNEKRYYLIQLNFSIIIFLVIFIINCIFWPSNSIPNTIINEFDLYYNSVIMDISTNCNNKSNNILGYFGGIPEGRTYTEKPYDYCPYNPINYLVGKCKEDPC